MDFASTDRQLLTLAGGNTAATLRAAAEGMSGVNAAMAYGTDGAIAALGLVALADDKGAQIVYAPAPVVRAAVLRQYPQIAGLLDPVFAGLTLATLQRLNAAIAVDGEDAASGRRRLSEIAAFSAVTSSADPATRRPALGLPIGVRNPVLLVLVVVAAVAAAASGFVALAPNRLVSGQPIALWAAAGAAPDRSRSRHRARCCWLPRCCRRAKLLHAAAALLAALLLLSTLAARGHAARAIAAGAGPAARVSLGAGVLDHRGLRRARDRRRVAAPARRPGPAALGRRSRIAGGFAALALAGTFDQLSIAREYATRHAALRRGARRAMSRWSPGRVGPALAIGFPLGVAAARVPRLQGPLFAVLNLLQTVPSIALFGLLIAPLSALAAALPGLAALGVGGIGPAPAIIALVLYALLPIVRNTAAGLAGIDRGRDRRGARHGLDRGARSSGGSSCRWRCRCCSPGCASSSCRRSGSPSSRR